MKNQPRKYEKKRKADDQPIPLVGIEAKIF